LGFGFVGDIVGRGWLLVGVGRVGGLVYGANAVGVCFYGELGLVGCLGWEGCVG